MPKIFRTMQKEGLYPLCGDDFFQLGVTIYPHENPDVTPDHNGLITPRTGGMSVFAGIKKLPGRLLPARLRDLYPNDFQKASGDDDLTVWCADSEIFNKPRLVRLALNWDDPSKPRHGSIEPTEQTQIDDFQRELCSTAEGWEVHEAPE